MAEEERTYHPWGDTRPFYSYPCYFRKVFGGRVQKLSLDAGFSCPNRDGTLGRGGCTFCNNDAFNPSYCTPAKSITQQLDEGIEFHRRRYSRNHGYLAYFQAYSNTYAPLDVLRARYEEALSHPEVVGLVIGTRPDCVDDAILDYIASLAKDRYVAVEYGIESCYNATLERVRRGHTVETSIQAVRDTAARGIPVGAHLILGLPGESREMLLSQVSLLNSLPLHSVKFHQLQILEGSLMKADYLAHPEQYPPILLPDYIALVADIVERLSPTIVVERFAGEVPPRCQTDPSRSWRRPDGRLVRNEEIPLMVESELLQRGSYQGKLYPYGPSAEGQASGRSVNP